MFDWLGPVEELTEMQRLMIERMLLPFEYLAKSSTDREAVHRDCFEPDGRGAKLDERIAAAGLLPPIASNDYEKFKAGYDSIPDPGRKDLYRACTRIACGVCGLSDCHHNTFRMVESWIHGIGTGRPDVPGRNRGGERRRIGQLLFGYVLGLDRWLAGVPLHFLLLDLGHLDLGFDLKNEISRVYAYLGSHSAADAKGRLPLMMWLAGSLWFNLRYNRPAGLQRHKDLLELAEERRLRIVATLVHHASVATSVVAKPCFATKPCFIQSCCPIDQRRIMDSPLHWQRCCVATRIDSPRITSGAGTAPAIPPISASR